MALVRNLACTAVLFTAIGCAEAAGDEPSSGAAGDSSPDPSSGSSGGSAGSIVSSTAGNGGTATNGGTGGSAMAGSAGALGAAGASAGKGGAAGSAGSNQGGPAPASTWVNATGNLAGMASDCYNMGRVAAKPGSARIIAGVALHGLFASDDRGKTWQPLGTGAGSAKITNRVSAITFDPEHPDVFWETGTHTGGGFYKTTDGGVTFQELGTMTMSQDAAIDFADPERKTLLTGTHGRGVYRSTDAGKTFSDMSAGLPGNTLWPLLIDPKTYLMATYDNDTANAAVFRTVDSGVSWTKATPLTPSHDGTFLRASDGSLYLPIMGNTGIMRSTDVGKTWSKVSSTGAAFPPAFFSITPQELPDGTLVLLGADHLLRSSDKGASWKAIGEPLPFKLSGSNFGGITYSAETKTFFVWHADCGSAVLPDAIMSAGFDYTL